MRMIHGNNRTNFLLKLGMLLFILLNWYIVSEYNLLHYFKHSHSDIIISAQKSLQRLQKDFKVSEYGTSPVKSKKGEDSLFYRITSDMSEVPTIYLKNYHNPCWTIPLEEDTDYADNMFSSFTEIYPGGYSYYPSQTFRKMISLYKNEYRKGERERLRCVPLVYMIGVTKSGTTDLFDKMLLHPHIVAGALKEPWWWNRRRIGHSYPTIPYSHYVDLFDEAAYKVNHTSDVNGYHPGIIMEGSPQYLWDYDGWEGIPGNKGLDQPLYTLANTLKAVVPQSKVILILRNPVDRLYSYFRRNWIDGTAQNFHDTVVQAVDNMNDCIQIHSLKACCYNASVNVDELKPKNGVIIRESMYYVFVKDWLKIFTPDQMLVIKAEEYYNNRVQVLSSVFEFLNLSTLLIHIEEGKNSIVNRGDSIPLYYSIPMLNETRQFLDNFFKPYNEKLARLLQDDKFRWDNT